MELIKYDDTTEEYTLKMSKQDFLDLMDMTNGVSSTPDLQDFTALGVTQQRVAVLAERLHKVLTDDLKERGLHQRV